MYIFKKVEDLQQYLDTLRQKGVKVGFIPTMGALHSGHISLIEASKKSSDITVCCIFVNPTQFDNEEDLKKYARNLPKDAQMLGDAGTDILFAPSVDEVYPPGLETAVQLEFGGLTRVMEGRYRTGHFEGMVQVVNRLLEIVQPSCIYMGQKDFQQAAIVSNMLMQQGNKIQIEVCPIIREENGLAMSSRNVRLNAEDKETASAIFKALSEVKNQINTTPVETAKKGVLEKLTAVGFKPEYFDIVDGDSLISIEKWSDSKYIVACVAAFMKDVRLIDNMILRNEK